MQYYSARYYNPTIGRFLSEDPMGLLGGMNGYSYVGDSPTNFVDPFGLDKCHKLPGPQLPPRVAMGIQGGVNLASNTISLAGNLLKGDPYGAWRSWLGMMQSDAFIIGSLDPSTDSLETARETANIFGTLQTASGMSLFLAGADTSIASQASRAESTLWGLDALTGFKTSNPADWASAQRLVQNLLQGANQLAGWCS